MQTPLSIIVSGMGVISNAGRNLAQTTETLFGAGSFSPLFSQDLPFLHVPIEETWLRELDLPQNTLPVNVLALRAVSEAFKTAGLNRSDLEGLRVGVVFGSTVGCSNYQEKFSRVLNAGEKPDPNLFFQHFSNLTSRLVARYWGLKGPTLMVSNACTSGADAIAIGANWLESDHCDLVICGGTEVILPQIYYGFRSLLLTSPTLCQPFDKSRQGLTLGEGAGVVILEKSNSPRKALAELKGWGSGSDAYHPTAPHPEARGLNHAVQQALRRSKTSLEKIDFINAHGTGTQHNDLAEGKWILKNLPGARVVATKGFTGHTLASAGAIEAVFTLMSLMEQKLPRSQGFQEMDQEIGLAPTQKIESGDFENAMSFSLGFGGTNSVLVFGRAH